MSSHLHAKSKPCNPNPNPTPNLLHAELLRHQLRLQVLPHVFEVATEGRVVALFPEVVHVDSGFGDHIDEVDVALVERLQRTGTVEGRDCVLSVKERWLKKPTLLQSSSPCFGSLQFLMSCTHAGMAFSIRLNFALEMTYTRRSCGREG